MSIPYCIIEPIIPFLSEKLDRQIPYPELKSDIQQVDRRMQLFINQEILESIDGVYTYIIIKINDKPIILFSGKTKLNDLKM
jgi:hypothetical protein